MTIGTSLSIGLIGLKAFFIHMQAFISPGLPYFSIIGLPDASLGEARERVRSACQSVGFSWPQTRVTVNLSPASLPKRGSSHDLAIAGSILAASHVIEADALANTVLLGELNLDGSVLPINGLLPIVLHARSRGITSMVIPHGNRSEAALVSGIQTTAIRHLGELVEYAGGRAQYTIKNTPFTSVTKDVARQFATMDDAAGPGNNPVPGKSTESDNGYDNSTDESGLADGIHNEHSEGNVGSPQLGDMADVVGQDHIKWAMQVAAAGGHHMLMIGPAGSGKTMLASRMPGILCPLDEQQQLEVASIRSLCGTLPDFGISDLPPFEAPHHTASTASLVGGGSGIAMPGSITRAHHGVLFMDEAPEFSPRCIQTLREPLESGVIALSRSRGTTYYPARFQLVMAANPCPCGFGYGTGERCICREKDRIRYFSRLSGPILDRIDIQVEVPPVNHVLAGPAEVEGTTSAQLREGVVAARGKAQRRFSEQRWQCNAQADGRWLRANTPAEALEVINQALQDDRISLRGADRTLRLAWTLADLHDKRHPGRDETLQSIMLRTRLS